MENAIFFSLRIQSFILIIKGIIIKIIIKKNIKQLIFFILIKNTKISFFFNQNLKPEKDIDNIFILVTMRTKNSIDNIKKDIKIVLIDLIFMCNSEF